MKKWNAAALVAAMLVAAGCGEGGSVKKDDARAPEFARVDDAVAYMLGSITRPITNRQFTMVVDDIYLENSKVLTPFSYYIKDLFVAACMQSNNIKLVQTFKDYQYITNEKVMVYQTSAEFDGFLQMNYYVENNTLRVSMKLNQGDTRDVLNAASVAIGKNLLPGSINYKPGNYETYRENGLENPVIERKDFKTLMWTERGLNGLYKKGEKFVLNVRSDRDCYVKIFLVNASGDIQLLFPNRWEGNNFLKAYQVYKIPSEKMQFEFEMSEPFGVETIKLVAQTEQFDDIHSRTDYGDNFRQEGSLKTTGFRDVVRRGINIKPTKNVLQSECGYTYNVVGR